MKIEEFEKLTKAKMVEEYKILLADVEDSDNGLKEVIKENSDLKKECSKLNEQYLDKVKEAQVLSVGIEKLEGELENKTVPQAEPDDEEYEGVPWSQLPENKLVEVVRGQNLTLNSQAKKLKKYKKLLNK